MQPILHFILDSLFWIIKAASAHYKLLLYHHSSSPACTQNLHYFRVVPCQVRSPCPSERVVTCHDHSLPCLLSLPVYIPDSSSHKKRMSVQKVQNVSSHTKVRMSDKIGCWPSQVKFLWSHFGHPCIEKISVPQLFLQPFQLNCPHATVELFKVDIPAWVRRVCNKVSLCLFQSGTTLGRR